MKMEGIVLSGIVWLAAIGLLMAGTTIVLRAISTVIGKLIAALVSGITFIFITIVIVGTGYLTLHLF